MLATATGTSYSDATNSFNLPDAPSSILPTASSAGVSTSSEVMLGSDVDWVEGAQQDTDKKPAGQKPRRAGDVDVDANGNPIPVDRRQTHRIGGIFPNYRAVSGGAVAHPPGWKYNFKVATRQSFDYSGFIFLGITSLSAEGLNEHKTFGKGIGGAWTYTWHGFLDKTDGTYLQAWLLPSLLHEDTRYYALGNQYSVKRRFIHVVDRQVITKTYGGRDTFNLAGFGGKILTQYISRFYYPTGTTDFGVLAEKFSFSVARDIGFTALREFYPDYVGYKERKKQRKAAQQSVLDQAASAAAAQSQSPAPPSKPQP
jgi:hypothetical protein